MNKYIEVCRYNTKTAQFSHFDKFEFRKDRPCKWLQKICLFILKKLSCFYLDEKDVVTRITIDQEQVIKCISEQIMVILNSNRRPKKVYMGHEAFERCARQLMRDKDYFVLQTSFVYGLNGGRKILGLEVETIPYMDGVLVI